MDLAHLADIGEVESILLLIDSSKRDREAFPEASRYDIDFDSPFVNVTGFEVVDASIPNTMYTVDAHNDTFVFSALTDWSDAPRKTIDAYLQDLKDDPEFAAAWVSPGRIKFAGTMKSSSIDKTFGSAGAGLPAVVVFNDIALLPTNAPLNGFSLPVGSGESYLIRFVALSNRFEYTTDRTTWKEMITEPVDSIKRVCLSAVVNGYVMYATAPAAELLTSPIGHGATSHIVVGNMSSLSAYGVFRVSDAFYRTIGNSPPVETPLSYLDHEIDTRIVKIPNGNHDANSLAAAISASIPSHVPRGSTGSESPMFVVSSTYVLSSDERPNYVTQQKLRIRSQLRFWLDMHASSAAVVMGFARDATPPAYKCLPILGSRRIYESIPAMSQDNTVLYHSIDSPGLISLLGERLIVLRCPQIESQAFSSLSHGRFSYGVGVFKMYDMMVAHLRFDFQSMINKKFHPIGKMMRLSFTFNRIDGSEYDFKGHEHHMIIRLSFLVPRPKLSLPGPSSHLNPDYDPDFIRYEARCQPGDRDSSDDEDVLSDPRRVRNFIAFRRRIALSRERDNISRPPPATVAKSIGLDPRSPSAP